MIEKAFSDYQILGDACNHYQGDLDGTDLYWAYQDAILRQEDNNAPLQDWP